MEKVKDFWNSNKYAIVWTICYVFIVWAIMLFMFGFNVFSAHHWHLLSRVSLHGFPGFVFGILLIAAIPLYVATTSVIIRTKKPLIVFNLPKFLQPKKVEEAPQEKIETEEEEAKPLPDGLPRELYEPFLRARVRGGSGIMSQQSVFNTVPGTVLATESVTPDSDLPLPPDFDIDPEPKDDLLSEVPVFSEVNFDDDDTGN